jgi:hypothetical protein
MQRILLSLPFLLLPLLFALPALAGNWGENWGTLTWGAAIAAVPTMGKLGVLVLALGLGGLAARVIKRSRSAASLLVISLVLPMLSPVANAQTVSVPNTLTNGSVADANAMNANFEAVQTGVNLALTSADVTGLTQFTNGTTADADEVNANFTAVVDGVNTALANRATDCAGAGGTWNAGTSTCTPASSYNCFVGSFCARAAIDYPPAATGYTNVYEGDTSGAGAALAAGCNQSLSKWQAGLLAAVYLDQFCAVTPSDSCMSILISSFIPCI